MRQIQDLVDAGQSKGDGDSLRKAVAVATACLHRFTAAFNACDTQAMDSELHFPHSLLAASEEHVWHSPGQHPTALFDELRKVGWAFTQYESITPLVVSPKKVHFSVAYSRRRADGSVLTQHENIWVVVCRDSRWGIVWRSY